MVIHIHQNKINIKNTKDLFNNYFLKELVDFFIKKEDRTYISSFIRTMFYLDSNNEYYETYIDYSLTFPSESENFLYIYNLFNEWNPINLNPISKWRGIFLELLTFKLLKKIFSNAQIFHETEIKSEKIKTNPIDFVIRNELTYYCFECKFSSYVLKKNQIDNLLGLHNHNEKFNTFLVLFEQSIDTLNRIRNSTFNYILNYENKEKIKLINIENFSKGNPFDYK